MRSATIAVLSAAAAALALTAPTASAAGTGPGSVAFQVRDLQNMAAAYGRIDGPGGQLRNLAYLPALVRQSNATSTAQSLSQVASLTHPAITAKRPPRTHPKSEFVFMLAPRTTTLC